MLVLCKKLLFATNLKLVVVIAQTTPSHPHPAAAAAEYSSSSLHSPASELIQCAQVQRNREAGRAMRAPRPLIREFICSRARDREREWGKQNSSCDWPRSAAGHQKPHHSIGHGACSTSERARRQASHPTDGRDKAILRLELWGLPPPLLLLLLPIGASE